MSRNKSAQNVLYATEQFSGQKCIFNYSCDGVCLCFVYVCACGCVQAYTGHSVYVEVIGQPGIVCFPLPSHGTWDQTDVLRPGGK